MNIIGIGISGAWLLLLIASSPVSRAASVRLPPEATLVRLESLLWRDVQNVQGEGLGAVSDVLVQMPSGRIVFVAVDPTELFQRPKAVPPTALRVSGGPDAPLVLDMAMDRWISAPRLDWDSALVIENTEEGEKIYGYYQHVWREPDPGPPWGMTVVASASDAAPAVRYVSLKTLLLDDVATTGQRPVGRIRDFLIDWPGKRVTHALVSRRIASSPKPDDMWFAIPAALLSPPVDSDAITVNDTVDAFRNPPAWPDEGVNAANNPATIYRYSVGPTEVSVVERASP